MINEIIKEFEELNLTKEEAEFIKSIMIQNKLKTLKGFKRKYNILTSNEKLSKICNGETKVSVISRDSGCIFIVKNKCVEKND